MTPNLFDLTDMTAIVSGAGRGLGRAMAKALAQAGAKIACGARSMPEVEETAAEIVAAGGHAFAVHLDAAKPDDCRRMVERAVASAGRLDIAVVNHGIGFAAPAEDTTEEQFRRMVEINLTGCFNLAQAAGRQMIRQGKGGSIILISSTASLVGFRGLAAYGASKGGVDQLCRQLAVEWGPHNIRVNCVNPGYTTHNMRGTDARHAAGDLNEEMRRMTPMGRRGTPEEIAAPVVFLASPAASFISGVVIPVDGGYCAM
jgi:NAD(P)-dependent dehydrogenase (short-subunit alcohol dehydrogenase family)